ncbi:hypothetical protein [Paramicrobacterium chengjingii]|uniref:hypothetical protein n=1 Tax=Paramicrobacterium chengjingii TaxID=2769067 RepID=UPI001423DEA9|nr:hypothetical protein [Microbacterium chengjingii]
MTEIKGRTENGLSRRTMVKGAAWSVPVIAVAAATPMAAASTTNASLAWTDSDFGLLSLQLIDGDATLGAQVAITVPSEFTFTNGPGAISDNATVTITVGRPSGINIPVGRARGFGVYSYNGVETPASTRTVTYQTVPVVGTEFGVPETTYSAVQPVSVASDGTLAVPVEFGLAGTSDLISISALASFPVTLTVDFSDGTTLTASSTISVPVGAGVL